jgi:hypothetical protein
VPAAQGFSPRLAKNATNRITASRQEPSVLITWDRASFRL